MWVVVMLYQVVFDKPSLFFMFPHKKFKGLFFNCLIANHFIFKKHLSFLVKVNLANNSFLFKCMLHENCDLEGPGCNLSFSVILKSQAQHHSYHGFFIDSISSLIKVAPQLFWSHLPMSKFAT